MTSAVPAPTGPEPAVPDPLRLLVDRVEIIDLSVRYARALDDRNWELLATCFTDDAEIEYEGMDTIRGSAALVEVCRAALDPLDVSQHLLGNHVVDLGLDIDRDGDGDAARSSCYVHAQHVKHGTPGGELYVVAGTYSDRLRRGPDGWRIAHRRLAVSWTDGNRSVLAG